MREGPLFWPNKHTKSARPPAHSNYVVNQAWSVSICTSTGIAASCQNCSGWFYIKRLVGCVPTVPFPVADSHIHELMRDIGPDEMDVLLEGAEVHKLRQQHVGSCEYRVPFQVSIPGVYRVSITVIRSDWDALNEADMTFYPPFTLDTLTDARVLIWLGDVTQSELARESALTSSPQLPACQADMHSGRWVRTSTSESMFDALAPPVTLRPYFGVGIGRGIGLSYYTNFWTDVTWLPHHCQRQRIDATRVASCLSGRRIAFHGDSQMRTLYNHFAMSVCGIAGAAVKGKWDKHCIAAHAHRCPGVHLCFRPDPIGNWRPSWDGTDSVDSIVANFGQHMATRDVRASAATYRSRVLSFVDAIKSLREERAELIVVWVGTQPYAPRTDNFPFDYADLRTNARLRVYNQLASEVLHSEVGAHAFSGYMDVFDFLMPVVDVSPDDAHLLNFTAALDPMVEMLIAQLGCS